MAKHNETGKKGEDIAAQILHHKGYTILKTNWRHRRTEIDIIAQKERTLVFVEVKTRSTSYFGDPAESITERKEALLIDAAGAFMTESAHEGPIRFDIISVIIEPGQPPTVDHYEDAFFPGME